MKAYERGAIKLAAFFTKSKKKKGIKMVLSRVH
jgi:hypothetical protein